MWMSTSPGMHTGVSRPTTGRSSISSARRSAIFTASLSGSCSAWFCAAFLVLRLLERGASRHTPFFFLGVGFTLMEAVAIVRLALLFGSTWIVNVVVFVAVLLTVFVANLSVMYRVAPPLRASWICLCAALAASYLFPRSFSSSSCAAPAYRGQHGADLRPCVLRLRLLQPALPARRGRFPPGTNLVGAMAGGWSIPLDGLRTAASIWLVALVVYALAWRSTEWTGARKPGRSVNQGPPRFDVM